MVKNVVELPRRVNNEYLLFAKNKEKQDKNDVIQDFLLKKQEKGLSSNRIQVSSSNNWDNLYWDSEKQTLSNNVNIGSSSEEISYSGASIFFDGGKYYWRIKFWDSEDNEGIWSTSTASFVMRNKMIQDLYYEYDQVGNILSIVDNSSSTAAKLMSFCPWLVGLVELRCSRYQYILLSGHRQPRQFVF